MRITDISDNFTKYTKKAVAKNITFSDGVIEKLDEMVGNVENLYTLTKKSILENDKSLLSDIDDVEEKIDKLRKVLIDGHIERLNKGQCKPESSGVFINLVSNVERLGDHLTFIAHSI
jgi:phosphate:Na+ symporter